MKVTEFIKSEDKIIIEPVKGFVNLNISELWHYRELLFRFIWRDLKVRYKQSVFGVLWAIVPPIFSMVIYNLIFDRYAKVGPAGIEYPIFAFTGILFWTYFANSLSRSSNSLVSNSSIVQKIYFPRLILPISSVLSGLIDYFIAFSVLLFLMFAFQHFPNPVGILLLPFLLFNTMLLALGIGLFFSSIHSKYRDIGHVLPFLIQSAFFLTPVVYGSDLLSEFSFLLIFNPMSAVIENARAGLISYGEFNWFNLAVGFIISLICFFVGIYYFRQTEKQIVDVI